MILLAMKTQPASGFLYFGCMLVPPGKILNAQAAPYQLNLNLWGWNSGI